MGSNSDDTYVHTIWPDMLDGAKDAGKMLDRALKDAAARLQRWENEDDTERFPTKMGDIRVHTQPRKQYADADEKSAVMHDAERILEETLDDAMEGKSPARDRFDEALAVLATEEERVFVVVITGNQWNPVYWDGAFGYAVPGLARGRDDSVFAHDAERHRVASPELADITYAEVRKDEVSEADAA